MAITNRIARLEAAIRRAEQQSGTITARAIVDEIVRELGLTEEDRQALLVEAEALVTQILAGKEIQP